MSKLFRQITNVAALYLAVLPVALAASVAHAAGLF